MSKFLDSIQDRKIFVDEDSQIEEIIAELPSDKLKFCLICGKPFEKSRAKYCSRQHYTECSICGAKIVITPKHINGVVPKTCSKSCADLQGVQTYKEVCMQKYGVSNPMYVPELVKDMVAKRNPGFDFSLKEEQIHQCEVCGRDFKFDYSHPRRCCSDECSVLLRKSSIASMTKICKLCGKPFNPTSSMSAYCEGPHFRNCVICGKKFQLHSNKSTTQTCSEYCKDKLYRRTCMERYGVEVASQSEQVKDKLREANKLRPKVINPPKPIIKPVTIKPCRICGKLFQITDNAQTICTDQHYRKCDVCGNLYPYNRPWTQLCCSNECTQRKRTANKHIVSCDGLPLDSS